MRPITEGLLPHQRALVEEYRTGLAPHAVALDGPPGIGKSRTLAAIAAKRAESGELVIVVVPRPLVSQWTQEFAGAGVVPTAIYESPADFRMAFDASNPPWPEDGLVVCSSSVLKTPLAARTLVTASPSLLVIDEVRASTSSALGESLRRLGVRAHQILTTVIGPNSWLQDFETRRWSYPLVDDDGRQIIPRFAVRVHDYEGDPAETALMLDSVNLLRQANYLVAGVLQTRSAIQFALLNFVRRLQAPEQLALWAEGQLEFDMETDWSLAADREVIGAVWNLLDRFDDLGPDRRLLATLEEVQSAIHKRRPAVIVTALVQEVDYLVATISSAQMSVSAVTAQSSPEERFAAIASLDEGGILVVTSGFFVSMQTPLPNGTRSVWFVPPRSQHQLQQRLGLGMSSNGVEIVLLRSIPPVAPADDIVERLERVLQNPWQPEPLGPFVEDI